MSFIKSTCNEATMQGVRYGKEAISRFLNLFDA